HVPSLPKRCLWYCDPAGAGEINRLRRLNITALKGNNAIREGIAAVSGRLQSGRLLIDPDTCPMLAMEGGLYHYDPDDRLLTETPVDRDNHALSALRYLVMGLLKRPVARRQNSDLYPGSETPATEPRPRSQSLWTNETCWTPLGPPQVS